MRVIAHGPVFAQVLRYTPYGWPPGTPFVEIGAESGGVSIEVLASEVPRLIEQLTKSLAALALPMGADLGDHGKEALSDQ